MLYPFNAAMLPTCQDFGTHVYSNLTAADQNMFLLICVHLKHLLFFTASVHRYLLFCFFQCFRLITFKFANFKTSLYVTNIKKELE